MNRGHFWWMLTLLLAGCGGEIAPGQTAAEGERLGGLPTLVAAARLEHETALFVGTLESADRAELVARVAGRVSRVRVAEGDRVRPGEVLLTLAETGLDARRSEADAAMQAAAARLALAEQTAARYRALFARDAVTPQEMDRVDAEWAMAREQLRAAEAALAAASTDAGQSRVIAPYTAQVARRLVREGTTVLPGTPLLVLERSGRRQVRAEIGEGWAERIRVGELLAVEIPAARIRTQGRVTEVAAAADPRSRMVPIRLELPEEIRGLPGQHARVEVGAGEREVLKVPVTAIVERGQLHGLYLVDADQRLRYRLVRLGREEGGEVEVLAGLSSGERIVSARAAEARDGARLEP